MDILTEWEGLGRKWTMDNGGEAHADVSSVALSAELKKWPCCTDELFSGLTNVTGWMQAAQCVRGDCWLFCFTCVWV